MVVWPTDLPQRVMVEGFEEAIGDGRLRTAMDAGPPKMRRRFSAVPDQMTISIGVSRDQKARLRRFWQEDIGYGSLPFLMPDWSNVDAILATPDGTILTDEADMAIGIDAWLLVFMGETPPVFRPRGRAFTASFPLIVLP